MEGPTRSGVSSSVASSSNSAVRRSAGGRRVVADDDEAGRHIDAGLAPQRERLLVVPVERLKRGLQLDRQAERIEPAHLAAAPLRHLRADVLPQVAELRDVGGRGD